MKIVDPYIVHYPTHEQKIQLFGETLETLTNSKITLDSKLSEMADYFYPIEKMNLSFEDIKKNAPDWPEALRLKLQYYEQAYPAVANTVFDKLGFNCAVQGNNYAIRELAGCFIPTIVTVSNIYPDRLAECTSLAEGYRIGMNHKKLKNELQRLDKKHTKVSGRKTDVDDYNQESFKRLILKCNPAQFATIIEMLMDRGYINHTDSGEGTARILLRSFEFEGFPRVSVESLGKKFCKKGASINPTDYKQISGGTIPLRRYLRGTKGV